MSGIDKRKIIINLYSEKEVDICLMSNFKDDWEDIKQDVFERLLRLTDQQLEQISNIRHYLLRIILNIKRQPYDPSAKLYRKNEELKDVAELHLQDYSEDIYLEQIEKIKKLHWYHKGIVELYAELGSVRAVSEATKIPFYSVKHTIKESRKLCK